MFKFFKLCQKNEDVTEISSVSEFVILMQSLSYALMIGKFDFGGIIHKILYLLWSLLSYAILVISVLFKGGLSIIFDYSIF